MSKKWPKMVIEPDMCSQFYIETVYTKERFFRILRFFFRPPDEIPRQIFTMQQESNGNPINLNIGPPPSCAPPTPPKKPV